MPLDFSLRSGVIALSWAVALLLVNRIWRQPDPVALKLVLSLIAFVPVVGPIVAYWIANFPEPMHPSLRDQYKSSSDVYSRWAHVLRMTDTAKRFHAWRRVRSSDNSAPPR